MFIFPRENNTGLLPVPFHHHSPLNTSSKVRQNIFILKVFSDREKKLAR